MRGMFNWTSGRKAEELKNTLTEKQAAFGEITRENEAKITTLQARINAKAEWLESAMPKVENKYSELAGYILAGDFRSTHRAISLVDKNILSLILRIPVITHEGKQTGFAEWAEETFSEEELYPGLRRILEEAKNSEIGPAFENIQIPQSRYIASVPSELLAGNLLARASGQWEEAILQEIEILENAIADAPKKLEGALKAIEDHFAKDVKTRLSSVEAKLNKDIVLKILESSLSGNMEKNRETLKTGLGILSASINPEDWLARPVDGEETPRLVRLLEASAGDEYEQAKTLKTVLRLMIDDQARAALLLDVAEKLPLEQAEAFRALAYAYTGDFAANELSSAGFAVLKTGFLTHAKDEPAAFRLARFGHNTKINFGQGNASRIFDVYAARPGFDLNGASLANIAGITRVFYSQSDNRLLTDYFGKGWNRETTKEEADKYLDHLAAADPDFVQLSDKTLIRKSAVDHAWAVQDGNGKYGVKYVIANKTHSIINITSIEKALEFLDLFAADNGMLLSETEMVRPSAIGNIWISGVGNNGACRVKFIIGATTYHADLDLAAAQEKIDQLAKNFGHLKVKVDECINPEQCGVIFIEPASAEKGPLLRYVIGQQSCFSQVTIKQAEKLVAQIKRKWGFVSLGANNILNPDIADQIRYSDDRLHFRLHGQEWSKPMDGKQAGTVFAAMLSRKNWLQLNPLILMNLDKISLLEYRNKEQKLRYCFGEEQELHVNVIPATAGRLFEHVIDLGRANAIRRDLGIEIKPDGYGALTQLLAHYKDAFKPLPEIKVAPKQEVAAPETTRQKKPNSSGINLDDFKKFNI